MTRGWMHVRRKIITGVAGMRKRAMGFNLLKLNTNPVHLWRANCKESVKVNTFKRHAFCVPIFLFAALVSFSSTASAAASAAASTAASRSPESEADRNTSQMTQEELQEAVLSYAKRYIAIIGQAAVQLEEAIPTDQAHLNAARRKVYSMTAVVETAAGPNPGPAPPTAEDPRRVDPATPVPPASRSDLAAGLTSDPACSWLSRRRAAGITVISSICVPSGPHQGSATTGSCACR